MTMREELAKGFIFSVCGQLGETRKFPRQDGEIVREIIVEGFGVSYPFRAESDEELAGLPPSGTDVRIRGRLRRKNRTNFIATEIENVSFPGITGWKPYTDDDFLSGPIWQGFAKIVTKRAWTGKNGTGSAVDLCTLGDTITVARFEEGVFDRVPENVFVLAQGHLVPEKVYNKSFGIHGVELVPVLSSVKVKETEKSPVADPPKAA